jgi:hypothetical protein
MTALRGALEHLAVPGERQEHGAATPDFHERCFTVHRPPAAVYELLATGAVVPVPDAIKVERLTSSVHIVHVRRHGLRAKLRITMTELDPQGLSATIVISDAPFGNGPVKWRVEEFADGARVVLSVVGVVAKLITETDLQRVAVMLEEAISSQAASGRTPTKSGTLRPQPHRIIPSAQLSASEAT